VVLQLFYAGEHYLGIRLRWLFTLAYLRLRPIVECQSYAALALKAVGLTSAVVPLHNSFT
jgi:hypothetical protein